MPKSTHCQMCGVNNPPTRSSNPRKFCSRLCKGRYHSGYTGTAAMPLSERLWMRVHKGAADECWPFRTAPTHKYGQIMDGYKPLLAHRVAYAITKGEIPDGMLVRHTCDNPPCCNPAHLVVGEPEDNSRDMVSRRRSARLWRISTTKLTDEQVVDLVQRRRGGEGSELLAEEFGVSRSHVNNLASGRAYRAILRGHELEENR